MEVSKIKKLDACQHILRSLSDLNIPTLTLDQFKKAVENNLSDNGLIIESLFGLSLIFCLDFD